MNNNGLIVILSVIFLICWAISTTMILVEHFTPETVQYEHYPTSTYNDTTGVYCDLMTSLCYSTAFNDFDQFDDIGVSMMFPK